MTRNRILAVLATFAALAALIGAIVIREEWGPDLTTDPNYRNGRTSFCKALSLGGHVFPSEIQDFGIKQLDRGAEHSLVYTFEAGQFAGGDIDVCSEYGFIKLQGTNDTRGRVEITVSNPFPEGERAVSDTLVAAELRVIDGRLRIGVAQVTQGVTSFRSYFAKGSRPATMDVVVQVPRNGTYKLNLTANHQRIGIKNLDVNGWLGGYASPGADIDASLDGSLAVRLSGVSYQAKSSDDGDLSGGTTARLQPLRSGNLEIIVDEADVRIDLVGDELGLKVTTNSSNGDGIRIGQTEESTADLGRTYAKSAGFERAGIQMQVHASSAKGAVTVERAPN